ncbi:hypothetical protein [Pontibacter saemangeumensis]
MRPEDVDKIFKERLGNTSPTPPTDLWNRLQERMQAETAPQEEETRVIPLLARAETRTTTWLYSSIAAAVSLVLSVGVVFYNIQTGTPEVNEVLADKSKTLELHEKPVITAEAPEMTADAGATTEKAPKENNLIPQATDAAPAASNITEADAKPNAVAKATPKVAHLKPAKAIAANKPKATVQPAVAYKASERAEEPAVAAPQPAVQPASLARAAANLNAEPVEIIIKRSAASPPAMASAEEASKGLDKKAKLAKNIFKQVRNLASGENVELSEVGINADKVALSTHIGKQKFSKVINL